MSLCKMTQAIRRRKRKNALRFGLINESNMVFDMGLGLKTGWDGCDHLYCPLDEPLKPYSLI